jgi:hypothetical protein
VRLTLILQIPGNSTINFFCYDYLHASRIWILVVMPLVNYDDSDEEINNNGLLNAAPAARVNVSYCYLLFRVGGQY